MPTNDAPEISVVIPVANEAAALPDCLARIGRRSSEILVVDAASDDPFDSRGPRDGLLLGSFGAVKGPAGLMREVRQ